jgi:ribose transport system substrate-binding protein
MRRRLFLASCAAAALIAGCTPAGDAGKTGADSAAKPGQKTFAMIPKGLTHVFWQTVHAGGDRGGKEFGYNIKWDGAQKESDTSGQIAVVENAIPRPSVVRPVAARDRLTDRRPVQRRAQRP